MANDKIHTTKDNPSKKNEKVVSINNPSSKNKNNNPQTDLSGKIKTLKVLNAFASAGAVLGLALMVVGIVTFPAGIPLLSVGAVVSVAGAFSSTSLGKAIQKNQQEYDSTMNQINEAKKSTDKNLDLDNSMGKTKDISLVKSNTLGIQKPSVDPPSVLSSYDRIDMNSDKKNSPDEINLISKGKFQLSTFNLNSKSFENQTTSLEEISKQKGTIILRGIAATEYNKLITERQATSPYELYKIASEISNNEKYKDNCFKVGKSEGSLDAFVTKIVSSKLIDDLAYKKHHIYQKNSLEQNNTTLEYRHQKTELLDKLSNGYYKSNSLKELQTLSSKYLNTRKEMKNTHMKKLDMQKSDNLKNNSISIAKHPTKSKQHEKLL